WHLCVHSVRGAFVAKIQENPWRPELCARCARCARLSRLPRPSSLAPAAYTARTLYTQLVCHPWLGRRAGHLAAPGRRGGSAGRKKNPARVVGRSDFEGTGKHTDLLARL